MERTAPRMGLLHLLTFANMAIIEMIPPEYWAQMRSELNALNSSELARIAANEDTAATSTACMNRRETPAERSARIAAEYDAAISRRQEQMKLEAAAARRLTPEYQEYQRQQREKRKVIKEAQRLCKEQQGGK